MSDKNKTVDALLASMSIEQMLGQLTIADGNAPLSYLLEHHVGAVINVSGKAALDLQKQYLASAENPIPLLVTLDCINGHSFHKGATTFPSQLALSSTWSPQLAYRVAQATAIEMRATGVHLTYSPVLDLSRDLRWGRTGETFGESTHLTSKFGEQMVKGYEDNAVASCPKHFLGYSDGIGGRDASEVNVSANYINDKLLPPFSAAINAGASSIMMGYHSLNGEPCTTSAVLVQEILREQLNFKGVVLTDWQNVDRLIDEHRRYKDDEVAASRFICSGADLQMGSKRFVEAVKHIDFSDSEKLRYLVAACRRVLLLKQKLKLLDDELCFVAQSDALRAPEHEKLALEVANESLILLKNEGVLPLSTQQRILVVGEAADDIISQLGDWSLGFRGQGDWLEDVSERTVGFTTLLDGLKQEAGNHALIDYLPLCASSGDMFDDAQLIERAANSDVILFCAGENRLDVGEMLDNGTLLLNAAQRRAIEVLSTMTTPLVTVYIGAKPLSFADIAKASGAFVCAFNPGMFGGTAIANALYGKRDFLGKMTVTVPHHVGQLPMRHDIQDVWHGDNKYFNFGDETKAPLYAFGHGLKYADITIDSVRLVTLSKDHVQLSITLTNLSDMDSGEVVQVYLTQNWSKLSDSNLRLIGFDKVKVAAKQTIETKISLSLGRFMEAQTLDEDTDEWDRLSLGVGNVCKGEDLIIQTIRELKTKE